VYRDWVGFYTTDEVLGLVRQMRQSFDEMAVQAGPGPQTRRRLADIFATSSRLEGAFWDMAYTLDQWPDLFKGMGGRPGVTVSTGSPTAP
jgi:thiaminase (transcriptional activator TenA)